MTSFVQEPFFWVFIAVMLAAVAAALQARRTNLALRRRNVSLEEAGAVAQRQCDDLGALNARLQSQHAAELAVVRQDAEEDTKAVLKAAMRTLQGLADEQQIVIDKVQRKYGDSPQILADLMLVDHANSQFGRRAQGIAVLCGGWLGRRESVASVYDVARSAQGRIRHFDRVRIHSQVSVSLASQVVEPVAVVLAELLANATNYSAPDTPVEISVQAVPTGVCLIIDDAGLGMGQEEKDRAAALLNPGAPISLTSLGNPPKFGFAVSGMLAARYGFRVSVDSVSPYGGVRAVVLLPTGLLSSEVAPQAPAATEFAEYRGEPEEQPGQVRAQASAQRLVSLPEQAPATPAAPATLAPVPADPETAAEPETTADGRLPRRRRQRAVSVVPHPQDPGRADEPVRTTGRNTASRLGAFQRGTLSGRDTMTTEGTEIQ
ncbi:sensor histidine kinase [Kitasatospora sp. RG8]|uniref:ATP-binding protein n=1 Tax=Kitasatospora sp. RG8 TaxID=2820815 RepID=UPI001AE04ABB|nr:ATP-binding protein [Kitasatospora sp. RG8]MBP0454302.1 sensor histidine kinase [Kitasatospora sp. RG8]